MADNGFVACLRINGIAIMISNHTMAEVIGTFSDDEKAAIMRMLEEKLVFRKRNRKRCPLKRAGFPASRPSRTTTGPRRGSRAGSCTRTSSPARSLGAHNLVPYSPAGTGKTHEYVAVWETSG